MLGEVVQGSVIEESLGNGRSGALFLAVRAERRVVVERLHDESDWGAFALDANAGGKALRLAEKHESLVDQMGAEIEEQSAAGPSILPPALQPRLRTKAIVVRLERNDPAQMPFGQNLLQCLEGAIPAAILINGKHALLRAGKKRKLGRLF